MKAPTNTLEKFDHEELTELKIIISSISLVVDQNLSCHLSKEAWLKAFSECNFKKLIQLAHYHGAVPWLAESLKMFDFQTNSELSQHIEEIRTQNKVLHFQNQLQLNTANEISDALKQESIDHLSFKGIAVLKQFYNGFIASRTADDLDLLINVEDLPKATSILINKGYLSREAINVKRVTNFIALNNKSYRWRDLGFIKDKAPKHKIDLHWLIADTFSFPTNTSELIKNGIPLEGGSNSRTLPFNLHFVYLCVHGYSDYFFRLRNLIDLYVAMYQPEFEHDKVMSYAKQYGVSQQVTESIQLVNTFFKQQPASYSSKFEAQVLHNYSKHKGWTTRAHPNKGNWTNKDKRQHLLRQIKHRSRNSFWFSPILARSKFDLNDANEWNSEGPIFYRLKRVFKKLIT